MFSNSIYKRLLAIIVMFLMLIFSILLIPMKANEDSKITEYLQEIMRDTEDDSIINGVFIELTIDERDYNEAKTEKETSVMCYSMYEGTGVVDAYCSYSALNQSRYATKTVSQTDEGSTYTKSVTASSSDAIIRVALSWLKKTNHSNFDLYVYKGSTLVAMNTQSTIGRIQSLRTIEFKPQDYGYGTYTIKVVYQDLNNSTESFSLVLY